MTRREKGGASYFYFFLILYFIYTPISRRILSCLVKLTLLLSNPAEGIAFQNPICQGQTMAHQGDAFASALRSVATLSNHASGGFKSAPHEGNLLWMKEIHKDDKHFKRPSSSNTLKCKCFMRLFVKSENVKWQNTFDNFSVWTLINNKTHIQ